MAVVTKGCEKCGASCVNGSIHHQEPCIEHDPVNHPKHYTSHPSGVECIDIVEHLSFNLGNAIKYLWRAGLKSDDPREDIEKARWYVDRELARLRKEAP